jgi:imidazolonepropionase-like amidohydrolase
MRKTVHKRLASLAALAVMFAVIVALGAAQANAQVVAIKAGKLVDPESGSVATNQIILVDGKKIEAVGASLNIPQNATVIDLSHATVMPGLFDAHTHLCLTVERRLDNGNYLFTTLLKPDTFRAIEGVANARDMLFAGFTTVRDVGNAGNYADTSLREAIEQGWFRGRRCSTPGASSLLTAGNSICSRTVRNWASRNTSTPIRTTRCARRSARTFTTAPS